MTRLLLALLLTGCAPAHWDTQADAVPYCMVLGEVPARVDGQVTCTGDPRLPPATRRE